MSACDAGPAPVTIRDQPTTFTEIARGASGDCCVACGKVGINLPVEHGCQPDIDPAEVANQPRRNFNDLLSSEGWSQ